MIGNEIPDGQGSVTLLLEECFELTYDLRNDAEDSSEADKGSGSDSGGDAVPK